MRCSSCGTENAKRSIYCSNCGKRIKKNKIKIILFFFIIILILGTSVFFKKNVHNNSIVENKKNVEDEAIKYIETHYGFSDSILQGIRIEEGNWDDKDVVIQTSEYFKEECKDGVIFYKLFELEEGKQRLICIYFTDDENNRITLKLDIAEKEQEGDFISKKKMNLRSSYEEYEYYCMFSDRYMVVSSVLSGDIYWQNDIRYFNWEGDINDVMLMSEYEQEVYEESVSVYELNEMKLLFNISRDYSHDQCRDTKSCTIWEANAFYTYSENLSSESVYGNTNHINLLSLEDFCNVSNEYMTEIGFEEIKFYESSWDERLTGLEIKEDSLPKDTVRVKFLSDIIENNGKKIEREIEIKIQ